MKYKNREQSISLYVELPQRLGDSNAIEVSVWYEKGGMSYFTYKQVPRGFFAAVKPVEIKEGSVAFMVMDDRGGKRLIAPAAKFSRKKLEAFAAAALLKAQDAANLVVAGQTGAALELLVSQAQEVAA